MLLKTAALALIAGSAAAAPCDQPDGRAWCDVGLELDDRVKHLVEALTPEEKAGLMTNTADAVPRLDIKNVSHESWRNALRACLAVPLPLLRRLASPVFSLY